VGVPLGLLFGFILAVVLEIYPIFLSTEIWSRYLLYFPGNLLAGIGLVRQRQSLKGMFPNKANIYINLLAVAFFINAFSAGLVVPAAPHGLASWLNEENILALSGVPVQVWRTISAIVIMFCFIGVLKIFEMEYQRTLMELEERESEAHDAELGDKTNAMQISAKWNEALVSISRRIADMQDVDSILQNIVETAQKLLEADISALALWNEDKSSLETRCAALPQGIMLEHSQPIHNLFLLNSAAKLIPSLFFDENESSPALTCPVLGRGLRAAAIVPLILDGQKMGIFWVGRVSANAFSTDSLGRLENLVAQVIITLEHALMASQLQSMAVIEERGRIAREMHDGISQILGYVSLELQTIEHYTQNGNQISALAEIQQAQQNVELAQADVRENILSLRTTLSNEKKFVAALQEYVDEFTIQTGIQTKFIHAESNDPTLTPLAEVQLVRIVQEALTNIRKHSQAKNAQVKLGQRNLHLCLNVADDGIGFEYTNGCGHYGLLTMRERAESINGGMTITSQLGHGTQVEVNVPLLP
jgi:nitrate/nitrite-specific signal transduction histidine kinase